jgi:hypothetical protein
MAGEGQRQILGLDTAAIIDDLDEIAAAVGDFHVDAVARVGTAGLVTNPVDWLWGLSSLLRRMARLWKSSGSDVAAIEDIIDGVVRATNKLSERRGE